MAKTNDRIKTRSELSRERRNYWLREIFGGAVLLGVALVGLYALVVVAWVASPQEPLLPWVPTLSAN